MPTFRFDQPRLKEEELAALVVPFSMKFVWFAQAGWNPHYFQILFHSARTADETLCRFRHLVAGRRGGKTLSAAWETLYYLLHPVEFHWDAHHKESDEPLWIWQLSKDYPAGDPALKTFRKVCKEAGLAYGKDYVENKTRRFFEFSNGSVIEFKSADEPEGLRGAGLDILWMDEAAFIPSQDAYNVVYPALSDKQGLIISTTTPSGKNWFYDLFWSDKSKADHNIARIEYRSVDNGPGFPREEWDYVKENYHPMLFAQEYMASFDAMQGRELQGDWLHYYSAGELPRVPNTTPPRLELQTFIGVDPAISLADDADRFAMALVGVTKDHLQAFLLDQYVDRIPFPEQIDKIREWFLKYRPQFIGVESNAYQRALVQQLERMENLPPIVPIMSKGKKEERILSMAPLFKIGKIKIRQDHTDFIDEWLNYDSTLKNPKDDALDSVEIALRAAGALLPEMPHAVHFDDSKPARDVNEWVRRDNPWGPRKQKPYDEHMGEDW